MGGEYLRLSSKGSGRLIGEKRSRFSDEPESDSFVMQRGDVGADAYFSEFFDDTADVSITGTSSDDWAIIDMPGASDESGSSFTHSISVTGGTGHDIAEVAPWNVSNGYLDLTTSTFDVEVLMAGLDGIILAPDTFSGRLESLFPGFDSIYAAESGYYSFDFGAGAETGTFTAAPGTTVSTYINTDYQVLNGVDIDWTFNFGDNDDLFQSNHFSSGWVVNAGGGNDAILPGYDGEHVLNGEGGDDYIWHAGLNSTSDGGADTDTIELNFGVFDSGTTVTGPVIINLAPLWSGGTATIGSGTAVNYEQLSDSNYGSNYADVITIGEFDTPYAKTSRLKPVWGLGGGDDTFFGSADSETIESHGGDDVVYGYDGNDEIFGGAGSDELYGGDGDDAINDDNEGGTYDPWGVPYGDDTIDGGSGNDSLIAYRGSDTVIGGTGDDLIGVYDFDDTVDGGADTDTLYMLLNTLTSGVTLDFTDLLSGGSLVVGTGSITGIERLGDGTNFNSSTMTDFDDSVIIPVSYMFDVDFDLGHGNDYMTSGSGDDIIDGYYEDDIIYGNDGDDELFGNYGDDQLFGGNGNDALADGAGGTNTMNGEAGDDFIFYLNGANTVDGGADIDTVQLDDTSGTILDLSNQANNAGGALNDTFTNVEIFLGTTSADLMVGDANDNRFEGMEGDDTLSGGDGDDTLIGGGYGSNTLNGGAGDDTMFAGDSVDSFDGGTDFDTVSYADYYDALTIDLLNSTNNTSGAAGDTFVSIEQVITGIYDDTLRGTHSGETFRAGDGSDVLVGRGGDDTLFGDGGDDLMIGGDGADTLRGGAGFDIVSYQTASTGVTVDLTNLAANTGEAAGDSYAAIEQYRGGNFDDTFVLDGSNADVRGMDGNDTLTGGAGRNSLYGDAGDDRLNGGDERDRLVGGTGDDILDGGSGIDRLYGDAGEDILRGGLDNDFLRGGADGDVLNGGGGNDRLYGDNGNDILIGSVGRDFLFGGVGDDIFRFTQQADSGTTASTRDTIWDFVSGSDDIDLTNLGVTDFIGSAAFTGAGNEVRSSASGSQNTLLEIDLDGDTVADMTILLKGFTAALDVNDFLLA